MVRATAPLPLAFSPPREVPSPASALPGPSPPTISPGPIVAIVLVLMFIFILAVAAMSSMPSTPQLPGPGNYPPPPAVDVIEVSFQSTDNACGLGGMTEPGFLAFAGSVVQQNWTIGSGTSCRISTVSAVTPGFQVVGSDVPLSMAAGAAPSLSVTLTTPGGGFSGNLVLDVE